MSDALPLLMLAAAASAKGGSSTSTVKTAGGWRGIDVSKHQQTIDWAKAASDKPRPIRFAIVKATQGQSWVDPFFKRNRGGARLTMRRLGFYHFIHFDGAGAVQARHFIRTIGPLVGNEFVALDVERRGTRGATDPPTPLLHKTVTAWIDTVEQELPGVVIALYANRNYIKVYQLARYAERCRLWVAAPGSEPPTIAGWPWWLWQFSGNGRAAGIKGPVDLNAGSKAFIVESGG